jgi:hypothetical protein
MMINALRSPFAAMGWVQVVDCSVDRSMEATDNERGDRSSSDLDSDDGLHRVAGIDLDQNDSKIGSSRPHWNGSRKGRTSFNPGESAGQMASAKENGARSFPRASTLHDCLMALGNRSTGIRSA